MPRVPKGIKIPYEDREEKAQYKRDYNNSRYCPERNKNNKLLKAYGISLDDYNSLLVEQEGCCAICKRHHSLFMRKLSVDHDHKTGRVRGLLCKDCNTSLGQFNDDVDTLLSAVSYLNRNK